MNKIHGKTLKNLALKGWDFYCILTCYLFLVLLPSSSYSASMRINISTAENIALLEGYLEVSETELVSGIQIEVFVFPEGWSLMDVVKGESVIVGNKEVFASAFGSRLNIIIVGFNNHALSPGALFRIVVKYNNNVVPADLNVSVNNLIFSTPEGQPVSGSSVILSDNGNSAGQNEGEGTDSEGAHGDNSGPTEKEDNNSNSSTDTGNIQVVSEESHSIKESINDNLYSSSFTPLWADENQVNGYDKFYVRSGMVDGSSIRSSILPLENERIQNNPQHNAGDFSLQNIKRHTGEGSSTSPNFVESNSVNLRNKDPQSLGNFKIEGEENKLKRATNSVSETVSRSEFYSRIENSSIASNFTPENLDMNQHLYALDRRFIEWKNSNEDILRKNLKSEENINGLVIFSILLVLIMIGICLFPRLIYSLLKRNSVYP